MSTFLLCDGRLCYRVLVVAFFPVELGVVSWEGVNDDGYAFAVCLCMWA